MGRITHNHSGNRLLVVRARIQERRGRLPEDDRGVTFTRNQWRRTQYEGLGYGPCL